MANLPGGRSPHASPGPDTTRARRRSRVERLYLAGHSLDAIVVALDASRAQITADLRLIRKRWASERSLAPSDPRLTELARIDRLEQEAWRAWKRSQQPVETTRVGQDARGQKAERTLRRQAGDPRYLTLVRDCIDRRCRILGLLHPAVPEDGTASTASTLREIEIVDRADLPIVLGLTDLTPPETA